MQITVHLSHLADNCASESSRSDPRLLERKISSTMCRAKKPAQAIEKIRSKIDSSISMSPFSRHHPMRLFQKDVLTRRSAFPCPLGGGKQAGYPLPNIPDSQAVQKVVPPSEFAQNIIIGGRACISCITLNGLCVMGRLLFRNALIHRW